MITAEELADSVAPEAVHSHIPQRPDFTDTSRPKVSEVQSLTLATARAVIGAVGGFLPDSLKPFAGVIVEVGTAAKIEQSYFPEQQIGNGAPAALLWDEYTRSLSSLVAQALKLNETKRGGFGMIGLHKRTARLWRAQERAELLRESGLISAAGVIETSSDDTVPVTLERAPVEPPVIP